MGPAVDIRWSRESERDRILAFVQEMGFNPRDAVTWEALNMTAMTAWKGGTLVGAVPVEPRPLRVAKGRTLPIIHETVVAVSPPLRNQGIGSRMQEAIAASPAAGSELATVFREEPESGAYRWYLRNGFVPAMHIDSWFADLPQGTIDEGVTVHAAADGGLDWNALDRVWARVRVEGGGFVDRTRRPLRQWLQVHPYRTRYAFTLVEDRAGEALRGYSLLGVGRMHSRTERVDVLEAVSVEGASGVKRLLAATGAIAQARHWRPIRWPIARDDVVTGVARELGFEKRWGFDMLVRAFSGEVGRSMWRDWTYSALDYI